MDIEISNRPDFSKEDCVDLFKANNWTAANKPDKLYNALINSHTFVGAWHKYKLVGLGNAVSDGHLIVYYSHIIVHPDFQGQGIGKKILDQLMKKYLNFHMQILNADVKALDFYKRVGFVKSPNTEALWIFKGD